jgi:hypothetical protein
MKEKTTFHAGQNKLIGNKLHTIYWPCYFQLRKNLLDLLEQVQKHVDQLFGSFYPIKQQLERYF